MRIGGRMTIGMLALVAAMLAPPARAQAPTDFRLPPGFAISEFAGAELANDIYTLAIDGDGNIVVSGRGYIRRLLDDDGDGRADRVIPVAVEPKDGATGLLVEGDTIYFTGDGGLRRLVDRNGDGRADGPSQLIRAMKTHDEHNAHALRRGPDGWLYLLAGNTTGIDRSFAQTDTSPIREPIAGAVLRFSPDLTRSEIVADGLRNAYDMDFSPTGELFTHDSDNERCVSLPWYEFTRCYHVTEGAHFGWRAPQRAGTWRFPVPFLDVAQPVRSLARGSPTGVACYRHAQFPEKYRGGLFLLDWTFGKVYFLSLEPAGANYVGAPEVFLEPMGTSGFAPTDLEVHPTTGDLYLSIGGRGSRGAVYRIRYPAGVRVFTKAELDAWRIAPRSLEWDERERDAVFQRATTGTQLERRRALESMARHAEHWQPDEIRAAANANTPSSDRPLLQASARLLEKLPLAPRLALVQSATAPWETIVACLATVDQAPEAVGERACDLLADARAERAVRLAALRLAERAGGDVSAKSVLGTVFEGYSRFRELPVPARLPALIESGYPAEDAEVDREWLRLAAMIELDSQAVLERAAGRITDRSDPIEDLHILIACARLRGPRSAVVTRATVRGLLDQDRKIKALKRQRDRNWPLRVRELHAALARADDALNGAMVADASFGRPDHALFAQAPGFDRRAAAERFWLRTTEDPDYDWTGAVIELVGSYPDSERLAALRAEWSKEWLRPAIIEVLVRNPAEEDRDKFRAAVGSVDLAVVGLGLDGLEALNPRDDPEEVSDLIGGLARVPRLPETEPIRRRFAALLERVTGQTALGLDRAAWTKWFAGVHPELAPRLNQPAGVDLDRWKARLAHIDWADADATAGARVFTSAGCAVCHAGGRALGPSLVGVARRFSRDDLLAAVIDPNRDVSDRYQTELIVTRDGTLYQGMVVYEAVDSLLLQSGAERTVRIDHQNIAERRRTRTSLMPTGLLDARTDQDIADLLAYLGTMTEP